MPTRHDKGIRVPVIRLRKTEVETLPFSAKPVLWYDTELKGFGVRVTTSTKAYFAEARVLGKTRRFKLGNHGALTADQARQQAKIRLGEMAKGIDPAAVERGAKARSVTLEEAFKAFLEDRANLKASTVADIKKAFRGLGWGRKQLSSITADMVVSKHRELGRSSKARANLTMRYLRALLNYAQDKFGDEEHPLFSVNPVAALSSRKAWHDVKRRRTVIAEPDLKAWVTAVLALKNGGARDYLMFVLLTGLRRTEALELRWSDVDLRAKTFTIPDPKNREPHTLPLSDYLFDLLTARRALNTDEDRPKQVFASARGPLSNLRYAMAEVEAASGISFCVHDLRRTFSTIADRLDMPAYAVKRLLNHKLGADVTRGYIVTDVERLRRPMQQITDYVLAVAGVRPGAEVLPIRDPQASRG